MNRVAVRVLTLLAGVVLAGSPQTSALLSDTAEVDGGPTSVGTLGAPGAPSVTGLPILRTFSWAASQLDIGGTQPPAVRYQVRYFTGPSDTTGRVVCDTTATSCSGTLLGQVTGGQVQVQASWLTWSARSTRTSF